jgi:hypothetical protein
LNFRTDPSCWLKEWLLLACFPGFSCEIPKGATDCIRVYYTTSVESVHFCDLDAASGSVWHLPCDNPSLFHLTDHVVPGRAARPRPPASGCLRLWPALELSSRRLKTTLRLSLGIHRWTSFPGGRLYATRFGVFEAPSARLACCSKQPQPGSIGTPKSGVANGPSRVEC